ncbi:MAG: calcium/sodium antiporter [Nitrospinales bacterium]
MEIDLLLIISGVALLFLGGEILVTGSVRIAQRFQVSTFVIGATVIGFGTSSPELAVSISATLKDAPEMALGNAIGSNIANVCLVLGATALLTPLFIAKLRFKQETPSLLFVTFLILYMAWDFYLSFNEGLVLLFLLAAYLWMAFRKREETEMEIEETGKYFAQSGMGVQVLLIVAGLGLLVTGANWLVQGSIGVARLFGVSEWLIGITIVAVGTSLPEIVASMIAARRGHSEMAIGNIYGSNIFNILMVLGATAVVHPLQIKESIHPDLMISTGLTCLFLIFLRIGHGLSKWDGGLLLICYTAYIGVKAVGII